MFRGSCIFLWLVEHRSGQETCSADTKGEKKERKKKRKKEEEEEEEGHRGGIMYGAATEQDEKEGARTSRRESPITCGLDDGAPLSFVGSHSNKTT